MAWGDAAARYPDGTFHPSGGDRRATWFIDPVDVNGKQAVTTRRESVVRTGAATSLARECDPEAWDGSGSGTWSPLRRLCLSFRAHVVAPRAECDGRAEHTDLRALPSVA